MDAAAARLLRGGHVQPDRFSCGAQAVVMARAVLSPELARRLAAEPRLVAREVLATHRELVGRRRGAGQLPWPPQLGTPPWAVARALHRASGLPHRLRTAVPWRRAGLYEAVARALDAGRPVPLYVGNAQMPRHVVLAVAQDPATGALLVHDPATGRVSPVSAARWCSATLRGVSWPVPWGAVLPQTDSAASAA